MINVGFSFLIEHRFLAERGEVFEERPWEGLRAPAETLCISEVPFSRKRFVLGQIPNQTGVGKNGGFLVDALVGVTKVVRGFMQ